MSIIQQPDTLSLSQNLRPFLIGATEPVSFELKKGSVTLLSQRYEPGDNGQVEIDVRDVVHSQLSYHLLQSGVAYEQESLVSDFTAIIDGNEVNFRAVRGGVDRLADSATNFLTQNWLTWQPTVKPVTYYSPEFLTYYAVQACNVKLKAYYSNTENETVSVTSLEAGKAYTVPMQYATVAKLLGNKLPGYYDVWVESPSGLRLTYVQRYAASPARSRNEEWILFENSLGGLDTFRAYGVKALNAKHTHNIAEQDEISSEYRVDTDRLYTKNTGYLSPEESRWLLDFFPSTYKYVYTGSYLRAIVVTESQAKDELHKEPASYSFTYKYTDARPLLNLPRTDEPADILEIKIPELGNFTLPPRLAEVPRLPLSEGDLFPIQNPYSESWSTTTTGALATVIGQQLAANAGDGGGVGHSHKNIDLLNMLSFLNGYLLVNGKKINAGYADKAGSVEGMDDRYLRKDQPDGTPYGMTFGDWVKFGEFITGISGGYIDKDGKLEMEEGVFRKRLFVPDIAYNRITYFKGRMCASPGGGCTVKEWSDNGDGSYTVTPDLTDADGLSQFVDDILTTYFVTKSPEGKLQGFEEMKFRVSSADYTAKTFVLVPKPDHPEWKPGDAMVLAQTGNFTDPERQTYILIDTVNGNNCITIYDHANTWDVEPSQEVSWFGKKKGRTVHGIPADNYSAVLRNVIMSGKIFQVDDITGEAFRVPLFKGAWKSGEPYAYFDEVTHAGSSWLCVNENGTNTEPSIGNNDWLVKAQKGTDGKDGVSVTNCGDWHTGLHVPYMGLTKMAGRIFLCKAADGTDNPPMWTVTTKDGNRILQTQDGKTYGYVITGEMNTAEYELLVADGKDGRDGKDYEWVFRHTTENVAPPTPTTSQVDDYVPSGWHDDAIGVSESLPYEWACCRTKKDGVWSAFSPSALWAKWGFDGESAIVADIDNEMESVALTYEGKTVAQAVLNTTVGMWYGTNRLQLKSISCVTPAGVTQESYNINTGVVAFTVQAGIPMPARSEVRITVTATVQDTDISRELVFTIAGVRAGTPGADAVLYRLVPSVSSVSKRKDGTYSVSGVSCTRTRTVGGSTSVTTDGVLKYSKDGSAEVEIQNGTSISPNNFTTQLQFVFYVGGQVVDRETIPMVVDGTDGTPGNDGTSIKAGGEWKTDNTPYAALTICTMGGRSWLSKVGTSNPPMWTVTTRDGNRILQTQDGGKTYGYIPTGEVNTEEWEQLTADGSMTYLVSTCSNIRASNAGSLVPSAFRVYAKRTLGSATLSYPDGYLAARGYSNGIWSVIAGPARGSELTVNASAGYSTFSVRCYQSQADASAWNDSFMAEQSIGVSYDGEAGRTGSEPRPRGMFANGNTYVWNERFHDIVLATFNNRTIPFRVRAYGTSVTVAPTSIDGDANWEPAQQFQFVATDLLLSRQIHTNMLVVSNVLAKDDEGNTTIEINGDEKRFTIGGIEINSDGLGSKMADSGRLDLNGNFMRLGLDGLIIRNSQYANIDNIIRYVYSVASLINGCLKLESKATIYSPKEIFYAVSGNYGLKINSSGIYKTSDGGTTWNQL